MKSLNSLKIMINNSANTTLSIIKRANKENDKLSKAHQQQKLKHVSYGFKSKLQGNHEKKLFLAS